MTEMHHVNLRFRSGAAGMADISAELSAILAELADPQSQATKAASDLGYTPSQFEGAKATVSQEAKGFGEIALLIIIAAPTATHILNKAWDDVIWPIFKSRLGADSIGSREDDKESHESADDADE